MTTTTCSDLPGTISFLDRKTPQAKSGDYLLTVKHTLQAQGTSPINETYTASRPFSVAGYRYQLPGNEIHACFPPQGNMGRYSNVFPHIALKNSTFPYERKSSPDGGKPWLALLLLDEVDLKSKNRTLQAEWTVDKAVFKQAFKEPAAADPAWQWLLEGNFLERLQPDTDAICRVIRLPDKRRSESDPDNKQIKRILALLKQTRNGQQLPLSFLRQLSFSSLSLPDITAELAQSEDTPVRVIDLAQETWKRLAPKYEELEWLVHVRDVTINGKNEERSVITTNRLPDYGGKYRLHLVSLENRYNADGQWKNPAAYVRLVSLKEWSFSCLDDNRKFENILRTLDVNRFQPPPVAQTTNQQQQSAELILLPHQTRSGGKTISYYRSPLLGGPDGTTIEQAALPFPAKNADALLRFDPDTGIFETQYAAAYEMGRLLTLKTPETAFDILKWKQKLYREKVSWEQLAQNTHLPLQQTTEENKPAAPEELIKFPEKIGEWVNSLFSLKYIPFAMLVPDERMLPKESIRFFHLDLLWIEALLDGALSIGRVTNRDVKQDVETREVNPLKAINFPDYSGFLVRSEAVSGWPDLDTKALQNDAPLKRLRMERLADDILICIFEGNLSTAELFLKPEGLHGGVMEKEQQHVKTWKNPNAPEQPLPNTKTVLKCLDPTTRTIDLTQWIAAIPSKAISDEPNPKMDSGLYSMQMIEGLPKIRFHRNEEASS